MGRRKVILLELNEINWPVVDRLVAQHGASYLPNFDRLRKQGTWATQIADERPPHLDPWITWVTLHTGVSREVHGASVLEQDSATLSAKRTWDYAAEAGRSVGVFGSISAYPPRPVRGFMIPGPFAPGDETFPKELQPVQQINRRYTQVHNRTTSALGPLSMIRTGMALVGLGLRPSTMATTAIQLAREKLAPHSRWKRVSLQPLLNFDFFSSLYRKYRPDFATWHSNHAAHYMHHYWRAWDDSQFPVRSSPQERARYGDAVPFGYRVCDELIGKFIRLADPQTVIVVASSMGQQPFVSDKYAAGKIVVRFRDIDRVLDIIGREGVAEVVPTMIPQWNIRVTDAAQRARLKSRLESVQRVVAGRREGAIAVDETNTLLTVTPLGLAEMSEDIRYFFPGCEAANPEGYLIGELFATDTPTTKQGMHHPAGILAFIGADIRPGQHIGSCSGLDVAPTLLSLLGVPVPSAMQGRVLNEAWEDVAEAVPA
ncbi:MAG: alkaline phosphatase family protein [Burkholderiaceae bacterium]|jgi:hypothetical protein